ncbi:MAG TPA: DUF2911 domain-containing protein, partial [Flavisolibacter sp.]
KLEFAIFAKTSNSMIKKLLLCASILAICATTQAQQLKTPAPSPSQTIKQDFGLSTIELSYSRPGMKGRKIYGDLVPFGKVWRTGANSATTLTFGDEVIIGGTKIPAGKYGLLSIPDKDNWTFIITKQTDVTSPTAYKQEMDVVRVTAKPEMVSAPYESFSMQFQNVKPTSVDLTIGWDKTLVTLPITADVDSKVMAQIKNTVEKDTRPYFQAAMYYLETEKDLNQALTWFDKAIEQNPNAFWVFHQKANALAKLGKKEEARQTATKSMEMAKTQKNDDYVKLNEKLISSLK